MKKLLRVITDEIIRLDVDGSILENVVLKELVANVLFRLSTETIFEKKHKTWLELVFGEESPIKVGNLGMGSKTSGRETWYDMPDSRLRGCSPPCACDSGSPPCDNGSPPLDSDVNVIGHDEPSAETDGTSTNTEFKVRAEGLSRCVATAVIASFTEKRLHPHKNAMVPTILINSRTVRIILYDCKEDVLLVSDEVDLFTDNGKVDHVAILFLWFFINHR